jgi:hypothetical protein
VKYRYNETETLLKETEKNKNKWKDISCLCIERISIVKTSILLKMIYRLSTVQFLSNTNGILHRNRQTSYNSYGATKDLE